LAIEEQFYLLWPLVVLAVLKLGRGRLYQWRWGGGSLGAGGARGARGAGGRAGHAARSGARPLGRGRGAREERSIEVLGGGEMVLKPAPAPASLDPEWERRRRLQVLFAVASLGSLASAIWMVFLAPNGYTTRAYYGTDCRAQALLVGAAISIGLTLWREGSHRPWFTRSAGLLGVLGVAGTAVLWMTASESSTFAFSGGFLVASIAAGGVVLACAVAPRSLAVRLLELPPLPQWGRISYGMYLWYWPVLLVMTGQRLHWGVYPLFLARVGITVAIAALSYDLVEMPIRRGVLRNWRSWVAAPVGAGVAIMAVFVSTLVPVGATELAGSPISIQSPVTTTTAPPPTTTQPAAPGQSTTTVPPTTTTTAPPPPTYLSLPLPPPTTKANKPIKVLIVGDSIAGTLGVGLAQLASEGHYKVQFANEGDPGCSVSMQAQIKALWYTLPPGPPCSSTDPDALFTTWRKWVNAYNPDVVLYVARGETFDQQIGGKWQNLGQASFDNYVAGRYREGVSVLGSKGATVVLMTSPYYDSGASPSGGPWPEDVPGRVQIDNSTIRQVASTSSTGAAGTATDGKVYVFDLNTVVDPANKYAASVGQINIRCGDGVHFSQSGGIYVGLRLMPDLVTLGQAHASASPGGAWPGTMPPSTPSWFPSLPCQ
jgi:peptidoglycan/LPS O-acetylase OafA/YrhL